ncbi:hypothetical protein BT63DRAFT_366563, partial [Microthyrium microscopicum]
LFMHDNASLHTAKLTKDTLESMGIPVMEFPPYLPNLNLIKAIWARMKNHI